MKCKARQRHAGQERLGERWRLTTCATRRYHGSGHPIVASFEPGEDWRWCYADEALI